MALYDGGGIIPHPAMTPIDLDLFQWYMTLYNNIDLFGSWGRSSGANMLKVSPYDHI